MRSRGLETRGLVTLRQSWSQCPGPGVASTTTNHRDPDADTGQSLSSPSHPGPLDGAGEKRPGGASPFLLEPGLETGAALPSGGVNQPPHLAPEDPLPVSKGTKECPQVPLESGSGPGT